MSCKDEEGEGMRVEDKTGEILVMVGQIAVVRHHTPL